MVVESRKLLALKIVNILFNEGYTVTVSQYCPDDIHDKQTVFPNLLFLGMETPGSLEYFIKIRQVYNKADLPIVPIIKADDSYVQTNWYKSIGADTFFVALFNPVELISITKRSLERATC